jgi:hypothetical protein
MYIVDDVLTREADDESHTGWATVLMQLDESGDLGIPEL